MRIDALKGVSCLFQAIPKVWHTSVPLTPSQSQQPRPSTRRTDTWLRNRKLGKPTGARRSWAHHWMPSVALPPVAAWPLQRAPPKRSRPRTKPPTKTSLRAWVGVPTQHDRLPVLRYAQCFGTRTLYRSDGYFTRRWKFVARSTSLYGAGRIDTLSLGVAALSALVVIDGSYILAVSWKVQ